MALKILKTGETLMFFYVTDNKKTSINGLIAPLFAVMFAVF